MPEPQSPTANPLDQTTVTITNEQINKSVKLQEQQSEQRHQYNLAMTQFHARQLKYALYIQKRKELLQMEKELNLDKPEPIPVLKKKSRPQMILQDGEWIELEGVITED